MYLCSTEEGSLTLGFELCFYIDLVAPPVGGPHFYCSHPKRGRFPKEERGSNWKVL